MELNVTYKWLIIKNMFLIVDWIALGIKGGVDLFIYLETKGQHANAKMHQDQRKMRLGCATPPCKE